MKEVRFSFKKSSFKSPFNLKITFFLTSSEAKCNSNRETAGTDVEEFCVPC